MDKNKYRFMVVREVAEILHKMKPGETLDFTFDSEDYIQEPTGWFGLKKVWLFDEPCGNIAMGDYGAAGTNIYSLQDNTVEEVEIAIQHLLDCEAGYKVDTICVELPKQENNDLGKKCYITNRDSIYYGDCGIIKYFDGDRYHVAIAGNNDSLPIFDRDEFTIPDKMDNEEKNIVATYNNFHGELDVFQFATEEEAREYMSKLWKDIYSSSLVDGEPMDEQLCWRQDNAALLTWEEGYHMVFSVTGANKPAQYND